MQRIETLLQKLTELSTNKQPQLLDIDLMLDYTRVMYADLLELRKQALLKNEDGILQAEKEVPTPPAYTEPAIPDINPIEKYADVPVIDLRTVIGINDKYLFIRELFGDDKAAYDETIKELNKCTGIEEANNVVSTVSAKYNWREEDTTVELFYNLVNKCFSSI